MRSDIDMAQEHPQDPEGAERSPVLTMDDAYAALQAGDPLLAETIAQQVADAVALSLGADTPPHAQALAGLANILMAIRDLPRAAAVLRRASAIDGADEASIKDQLTWLMNLGEILTYLGRFDEAEQVLRDGLIRRRAFYPAGHPGVAYGLEPLAELLLTRSLEGGSQEKLVEAALLCDEAVAIFWRAGHAKIATALVQRAAIRQALGEEPLFDASFEALPDQVVQAMIDSALSRASLTRTPAATWALLQGLRAALIRRSGADTDALLRLVSVATNLAREAGLHEQRLEDLTWLREVLLQRCDIAQAQTVTLAMALAAGDLQRPDLCDALYRQALLEADQLAARGNPEASARRSCTLRNHGLWLAEQGRREEAGALLAEALQTSDADNRARAQIAYGIFLQHGGDLARAEPLLQQGLETLPPQDGDALCGRSHLDAIRSSGSCGCGNTVAALTSALRQIVDPHLPPDLVADLQLDESFDLRVTLAREPGPDELEQLERVLQQGMATLRRGAARP